MRQLMVNGDSRTIKKLKALMKDAERDSAYRVATRIRAVILCLQNRGAGDIAQILSVDRTRIPVWINKWNLHGETGLLDGYRSGRKKRLDEKMLDQLQDIVESGPVAYGMDTGIWNSIIIAKIIEDEFGVHYHQGHVRKLLRHIGFSVQRPTVSLIRAEEKTKNRWIRYTFPNLKKSLKKKAASSSMKTKRPSAKTRRSTKPGRR